MKNTLSLTIVLILCCACGTQLIDNRAMLTQRAPLAQQLEQQEQYSDALTQWKILQIAYPEDELVREQVLRLEQVISGLIIEQLHILDQAKASNNRKKERQVYLNILALDPNNKIAFTELAKFEWQYAFAQASSKTETIKNYFVESQEQAKRSIQLTKFLEQGQQFTRDKKYSRLLQLADKFSKVYPDHPKPNQYRIWAYTKLGETQQKNKNLEAAIDLYQQALQVSEQLGRSDTNLRKKTEAIKKQVAAGYFKLANKIFKKDLDQAIQYFELTLKFQPNHNKARELMRRAVKMRDNLNRIKKLNANYR